MQISIKEHIFYILFWLYAVLTASTVYSQSYFETYQNMDVELEWVQRDHLTDSLINRAIAREEYREAAKIAHKHSIEKNKSQNFQGAIAYGLIEIDLLKNNHQVDKIYIQALYNVGRFYYKNDNFEAAERMHQEIVRLDYSNRTTGRSYCEIGRSHFAQGDYYKAVDFYRFGIAALENAENPTTTIRSLIQLSNIYEQINTPKSLEEKYKLLNQALKLSTKTALSKRDEYALYNSLASYFHNEETFDFKKARRYMNRSLDMALSFEDDKNAADLYSNLGNLYDSAKRDSAYYYFQKALSFYADEGDAIRTFNNLASFHIKREQYDVALFQSHRAISYVSQTNDNLEDVPTVSSLIETADKYSVLRALLLKSTSYLGKYDETRDNTFVEKAFENLKVADGVIDFLLKESTEMASKFHWRKTASAIYAKLVRCSYLADKEDLMFYYAEKNKALLLTTSILENAKKKQLPDSIRSVDLRFRKEIIALQEVSNGALRVERLDSLEQKLFNIKEAHRSFQKTLEHKFPNYFLSTSQGKVFDLSRVKETLEKNKLLVSITWNEVDEFSSSVFVLIVARNQTRAYRIKDPAQLKRLVHKYRNSLSKPFSRKEDRTQFIDISNELYHLLFPTESIRDFINNKHLVIIPDGDLQGVPFEALVLQKEPLRYVLQQQEVSYAYSASFQLHNESLTRKAGKRFVAFSPISFLDSALDSLPNAKLEMASIEQHIHGDSYFRSEATKSQFLKGYNQYQIVHLATHANAIGTPWIAFNDSIVSLAELYTAPNNAELVVLSACNTAIGERSQGEGVLSLERGFFYSGAHAVVSSLWNVNDKSAAILLGEFYKNLDEGMSKSQALRNAKLVYLRSHSLSEISPYYWAPYIVVGNTDPVPFHASPSKRIWLWGLLLFTLIFLLFLKKIKK